MPGINNGKREKFIQKTHSRFPWLGEANPVSSFQVSLLPLVRRIPNVICLLVLYLTTLQSRNGPLHYIKAHALSKEVNLYKKKRAVEEGWKAGVLASPPSCLAHTSAWFFQTTHWKSDAHRGNLFWVIIHSLWVNCLFSLSLLYKGNLSPLGRVGYFLRSNLGNDYATTLRWMFYFTSSTSFQGTRVIHSLINCTRPMPEGD